MIFVTLGTQDKGFPRLLEAIDKEIEKGTIKEKVIVQAGLTKYESKDMEIFDLVPANEFEKYIDEADLIITHGGAGSILTAIKHGKKVIAAARLAKYKEHTNDHQKQIVKEFSKEGYILELRDFNKLGKLIEKSKHFTPKKFESNTNNMVKLISNYIEDSNHISWFNKYREIIYYLFFMICTYLLNIIINNLLLVFNISKQLEIISIISWLISILFIYITNKKYVFSSTNKNILYEFSLFFIFNLLILLIIKFIKYVFVIKLNLNFIIVIIYLVFNYIFSKYIVFKNENLQIAIEELNNEKK